MSSNKVVESPDRDALKRRYARINWNAHLVPVVREAVADFGRAYWAKGHPLPHVALRSEAVARGEIAGDSSAEAADSLTVQFGVCPSGIDALAPSEYGRPLVAAGKAALVFTQAASGAVAVFLYPAATPAAKPHRVGDFSDPADLSRSRVRRLLRSLFDMHRNDAPRPAAAAKPGRRQFAAGNYKVS